jgi:thiamine-phosphate pyrophosphorylase
MAERCLLCYITDRTQFPGDETARRRAVLAKIAEAAHANVHYIQLREKDLSTRELEQLAREAAHILQELRTGNRELRTRLLINSRTDIAIAVGADGVHLRSDDISAGEVRHVWASCGAGALAREKPQIAVSCHSRADMERAQSHGADLALFAPVFEKKDRPSTEPAGLAALREACRAKIPVLALGGVTLNNAASCLRAGASGIAAIRLFQENKIEDIVGALRAL